MVHAYNAFNVRKVIFAPKASLSSLSAREDEGMAYAFGNLIKLGLTRLKGVEKLLERDDACDNREALKEAWQSFWRTYGTPQSYGNVTYGLFNRNTPLERSDFALAKAKLGLHISCKEISGVLNSILEMQNCCFKFQCDNQGHPADLYPGVTIDDVFK
jgi:hypothetical protein